MISPENNNDGDIAALKNQVFTLLVALIVVSGTLTVFLYRQASLTNKDIAQTKQMSAILSQNENNIAVFVTKLVAYGEKHPDFVPLLKKYGIAPVPGVPANTAMPGGAPAAPNR
jgi:hypothetical protein